MDFASGHETPYYAYWNPCHAPLRSISKSPCHALLLSFSKSSCPFQKVHVKHHSCPFQKVHVMHYSSPPKKSMSRITVLYKNPCHTLLMSISRKPCHVPHEFMSYLIKSSSRTHKSIVCMSNWYVFKILSSSSITWEYCYIKKIYT